MTKEELENYEPKGELIDFPKEIIARMLNCQEEQGNKRDISVFENIIRAPVKFYGFSWNKTKEGWDFWNEVISNKNFDIFFEKYPKKDNQDNLQEFKVGDKVHFLNRNGAEYGELDGVVIDAYEAMAGFSDDGFQYDVKGEKKYAMAFSQELTLLERVIKISPRSSFTAELMLEDAIEAFGKRGVIDAERVVRALTEIKEELKEEFDHQYELELIKRGRR